LCDLVMVRLSRSGSASVALLSWVIGVGVLVMLPMALLIDGVPAGSDQWLATGLAAIGGLTYVTTLYCLVRALRVGMLAIVSPLVALEGAVAALGSFALGERVGRLTVAGLVLAVTGSILAKSPS
ncbi:MAG TPA: EamA family transporter, partial [Thermoleophilia bacterium]|nr:EamA family transporter [Thermoleophilia bacterium]